MRARGVAWRALWPVWVPAVAFLVLNLAAYGWLSGKNVGRQAQIRADVERLEARVEHLRKVQATAAAERGAVVQLNADLQNLYGNVFGSLSERLTGILRSVGDATRQAGLHPEQFRYSAKRDQKLKLVAFGVQFAVTGRYEQIKQMLAALQASPELLIIDQVSIGGESGTVSNQLEVAVHLTTYLASADEQLLKQLTGGLEASGGGNVGD